MKLTEFDLDIISATQEESAGYKSLPERFNPFEPSHIITLVTDKVYSEYLCKIIQTVQDAAWHGKYITEQWASQDAEERITELKLKNKQRVQNHRARVKQLDPELELAKTNWKTAIAQKKAVIEQWDTYIASLHLAYLNLQIARRTK
jgi:hypothetical protein